MTSNYYNFFNELSLEVRGTGGRSTAQFRTMYDHFEVSEPIHDPDIVVETTVEDVELETVLGDPSHHYGWTGSQFVIRNGPRFMAVDPGWKHLYVSPDWEPFYAIYPVEFHLRRRVAGDGRGLMHASGVQLDGTTTLFPAWRGAGKTNTLISLLRAGGDFLADDRLWVGSDGSVQGFPLSINLQPYNIRSFPEIQPKDETAVARIRRKTGEYISQELDLGGSIFEKGLKFLSARYIEERGRSFTDVRTLFPQSEYVDQSTVDAVVVLLAAPNRDSVHLESIPPAEAAEAVEAISYYEWNARLEEYFRAYDSLVPDGAAIEQLTRLIEAETRSFTELFEDVDTYRALIPRHANWGETGVDRQVVSAFKRLGQQDPLQVYD